MREHDKPYRFSRVRIKQILARATELESRDDLTLTEAELREVAVEAGIDLQALEQAIAEIGPDVMLRPDPSATFDLRTLGTAIKILAVSGLIGTGLGAFTGVVRVMTGAHGFHPETLAGLVLIGVAVLGASVSSRATRAHVVFQLKNLGLWSGFSLGFAMAVPSLTDDIAGVGLISALVSALIGSFIVAYRHRKSLQEGPRVLHATDPARQTDVNDMLGTIWRQRASRFINGLLGTHRSRLFTHDLSKA